MDEFSNVNAQQNYENTSEQPQRQFFSRPLPTYEQQKQYGLRLFEIPIFSIFNPRSAVVVFSVDCKSNALKIKMAPAIPNNPAIGARGPVPKNIRVYDYSKEVVSNFADVDTIDFLNFLKSKFLNSANEYGAWIASSTNSINAISQYITNLNGQTPSNEILTNISNTLNEIKSYYLKFNVSAENQMGLYRRSPMGDKAWNFVYDPGTHMMHINVMAGKNKENRISCTISAKMALRLMNVVESYVNGFSSNQLLTNLSVELSNDAAVANERLERMESMLRMITSRMQ